MRPQATRLLGLMPQDPSLAANPSSNHEHGRKAKALLDTQREMAAEIFNAKPAEIIFNSGGSEGDTHALVGIAELFNRPVHIAISAIDHEAVQMAALKLQHSGHQVSIIPVTPDGVIELDYLEKLLKDHAPELISVMAVNNETGVVQPAAEIGVLCREHNAVYHCDAVRAVGHGFKDIMGDQNITLINCTAHKFGGPRGVGILVTRGIKLPQLICGGSQEGGSRAGTENLAGISAMMSALNESLRDDPGKIEAKIALVADPPEAVLERR